MDFDATSPETRWLLIHALFEVLHAAPGASGLAAPMTGVGVRVVVSTAGDGPLALINPVVRATEGPERVRVEANVSLPGIHAPVARRERVTIEWQSVENGDACLREFSGWEARVLMHEMEILDGRLFIDHATDPPLGSWLSPEDRARRAAARVFGDERASLFRGHPLGLVTLPPTLHGYTSMLTQPTEVVDLAAIQRDHLRGLVESMWVVQHEYGGVGLAAPQIGVGLKLAVIDAGEGSPLALINPEIVDREDVQETASEGCLSIPGWRGEVSRSRAVRLRYQTASGETAEREIAGNLARIAQHEVDHLDGVLFSQLTGADGLSRLSDATASADEAIRSLRNRESAAVNRQAGSASRADAAKRGARRRR